jgi:hypothetical protein
VASRPLYDEFLARVIRIEAVQRHRVNAQATEPSGGGRFLDARTTEFFESGRRPGVWGDFLWALDKTEPFPPITMIAGENRPPAILPAMQVAWTAAAHAFQEFIQELRTGKQAATGVPASGGARTELDPAEWSRAGLLLDVRNGDLIEQRQSRQTVRWTAITLTAVSVAQGKIDWDDFWKQERDRYTRGLLPPKKRYPEEAEQRIKDRYGVKNVPVTELRRLRSALYRGDTQRPRRKRR